MNWKPWKPKLPDAYDKPDDTGQNPCVVLHLPSHMLENRLALPKFYQKLRAGFTQLGVDVNLAWRNLDVLENLDDRMHVHFVHNGNIQHPRVLNTGVGYIYPFWYCDPLGIFAESSVTNAKFDPSTIDANAAFAFFDKVAKPRIRNRRSRYDQPKEKTKLPEKAIAFFLQGSSEPVDRARYLSELEIFETLLKSQPDKQIIIKPHPRNASGDTAEIIAKATGYGNITVTDANIHDIFAVADVTVSICSATALEGMMHQVPAILCGKSDMHHCAITAKSATDLENALLGVANQNFPFQKFIYWFLNEHLVDASDPDFITTVVRKLGQQGIDVRGINRAT